MECPSVGLYRSLLGGYKKDSVSERGRWRMDTVKHPQGFSVNEWIECGLHFARKIDRHTGGRMDVSACVGKLTKKGKALFRRWANFVAHWPNVKTMYCPVKETWMDVLSWARGVTLGKEVKRWGDGTQK